MKITEGRTWSHALCVLVALAFCNVPMVEAQLPPGIRVVALSGSATPDGNGVFGSFGTPSLNNAGQVVFRAFLNDTLGGNTDNQGLYLADSSSIAKIARNGDVSPFDGRDFLEIERPSLNDAGQVAFRSRVFTPTGDFSSDNGIFLFDGGQLTSVAQTGVAAPDGDGNFLSVNRPEINASGEVAYYGVLDNTAVGRSSGIYRSGNGSITEIARVGRVLPAGDGIFEDIGAGGPTLAFNDAGQVAFGAVVMRGSDGDRDTGALFLSDGSSTIEIQRFGQTAPSGDGILSSQGIPLLNDNGHVLISNFYDNTAGGGDTNLGISLYKDETTQELIRKGDIVPSGNGTFGTFGIFLGVFGSDFNNSDNVAFYSQLNNTNSGNDDNLAIFLTQDGILKEVVRRGQPAPDGNGVFSVPGSIDSPAPTLNDSGQVIFFTTYNNTVGDSPANTAIVFYDANLGLQDVVRQGDSVLGSAVTRVDINQFSLFSANQDGTGRSLNDRGEVAFRFSLADGRSGIALWSIPEPATAYLLLLAMLTGTLHRSVR